MTAQARRTVLESLGTALQPGGVLVLGADEAFGDIPDKFEAAPGGRGLLTVRTKASASG
jgi:chemotaxis methyl-accepting protein methylase